MTSRPRATSSRTNSGATHSRCATRRISAVIRPFRAASSCVMSRFPPPELPGSGSRGQQARPAFSAASSGAAPPAGRGSDHYPEGAPGQGSASPSVPFRTGAQGDTGGTGAPHGRAEVEAAFQHYWQLGPLEGNWDAWADLFTGDALYMEPAFGTLCGPVAIRRMMH